MFDENQLNVVTYSYLHLLLERKSFHLVAEGKT